MQTNDTPRVNHRAIANMWMLLDGFFDAGMLKQALKSGADSERKKADGERRVEGLRRNVGKKLRLTEY